MRKSTNFSRQPLVNQLTKFIDKSDVKRIVQVHKAEWHVKKFSTYNHLLVMLFVAFEGYHSINQIDNIDTCQLSTPLLEGTRFTSRTMFTTAGN